MNSQYYLRITIVPRVMAVGKKANAEDVETWPIDGPNVKKYDARPLSLNAGEEIRQGVKEGTNYYRLEIKGERIPVEHYDRVKIGDVWHRLTAPAIRERFVTVITLESL